MPKRKVSRVCVRNFVRFSAQTVTLVGRVERSQRREVIERDRGVLVSFGANLWLSLEGAQVRNLWFARSGTKRCLRPMGTWSFSQVFMNVDGGDPVPASRHGSA